MTPEQQLVALSEAYRVVKPGGTFEFSSQIYFGDMVECLTTAGFKNVKIVGSEPPQRLRFRAEK